MGQPSNSVREQVRQFVLEYARPRGINEIADDESLFKGNAVDSLGVFRMISFLEESFPITIEDTDIVAENFETILQIEGFINRKQGLPQSPAVACEQAPVLTPA
ncbi:MAG TPA: acyl carrier protein [Terriglobales bacterium]|nr:acyl carrier protein [Terriglobales bacterium]